MSKVFLGGTCNNTVWREKLISMLEIDYFNPVVEDWTEDCMIMERYQRQVCDFCLYVITPSMTGVYSIAEVIDDSNKRPERTIFCLLTEDVRKDTIVPQEVKRFNEHQLKSLKQVGTMVERNGGKYFTSLNEVAEYVNLTKYIKSSCETEPKYMNFNNMMKYLHAGCIMQSSLSDDQFKYDIKADDYYYRSTRGTDTDWKLCKLDEGLFTSGEVQSAWKVVIADDK